MAPWKALFPCLVKRKKVGPDCDFHGVSSVGARSDSSPPLPSRRFAQEETEECVSCHTVYTPGAKFCANCGHERSKPLSKAPEKEKCPSCNTVYTPGANFCAHCGQRKGAQAVEASLLPGALQASSPDTATPAKAALQKAPSPAPKMQASAVVPKAPPAAAEPTKAPAVKAPGAAPETGASAHSQPDVGNYIVDLRRAKPTDRFGFAWDAKKLEKENMRVISKVLPGTLAEAWNRTAPPGCDVRPGDLLVKVNGKKGRIELLTVELSKLHVICEFQPEQPRKFGGAEAASSPASSPAAASADPEEAAAAPAAVLPPAKSPPPPQPKASPPKATAAASSPTALPKAVAAPVPASMAAPGASLPVAVTVAKSAVCPPAALSAPPTPQPVLAAADASPAPAPALAAVSASPTPEPTSPPASSPAPPAPMPPAASASAAPLPASTPAVPAPVIAAVSTSPTSPTTPTPSQPSDPPAKDRAAAPAPTIAPAAGGVAKDVVAQAPASGQPLPEDLPPKPGEAPSPPQLPPQPLEAMGAPSEAAQSASSCVEILEEGPAETPELDHPANSAVAEPVNGKDTPSESKEGPREPKLAKAKEEPAVAEPSMAEPLGGLYIIELQRGALSEKWGFQWDRQAMDTQNMKVIEGIAPNSLASDWNRRFPDRAARKGDQLTKVNGLRDPSGMAAELKKSQVTCEFRSALPRDGDSKAVPLRPRPELTPLKMPAMVPEPASVAMASG